MQRAGAAGCALPGSGQLCWAWGPARLVLPLLLLAGCAAAPEPPLWLAERGLVWCYRTLADPDCHRWPLAGAERRLIATAPQIYLTPRDLRSLPVPELGAARADGELTPD